MNVSDVVAQFPDTVESDWRQVGKGWAHRDAMIDEAVEVCGPAIFRYGEFHGGAFWGGEFWNGTFYGGKFHDGLFRGGTFRGGTFYGGAFRGGEFRGGVFFSGFYYRGVFHSTPLQLFGVLPWMVNVCGPREIRIGCEYHTLNEWESKLPEWLRMPPAGEHEAEVRTVLQICRKWFEDNPDCVTEEDG